MTLLNQIETMNQSLIKKLHVHKPHFCVYVCMCGLIIIKLLHMASSVYYIWCILLLCLDTCIYSIHMGCISITYRFLYVCNSYGAYNYMLQIQYSTAVWAHPQILLQEHIRNTNVQRNLNVTDWFPVVFSL